MSGAISSIAAALRALPDEHLVEAAARWLIERAIAPHSLVPVVSPPVDSDQYSPLAWVPKKRAAKTSKPIKPAKKAPKPVDQRASPVDATEYANRVFAALAANPEPMSAAQVATAAGILFRHAKAALARLKREGRASLRGRSLHARWSVGA